jgi:hypothetical protein
MKMINERFPNKNVVDFQGIPLFNHILRTVSKIELQRVLIFMLGLMYLSTIWSFSTRN